MCAVRPAWLDLVSLSYRPLVEKRGRRERRPRECSHALADLHGLHARGRLFARRKDLAVADDRLGRDGGLLVHDRALLGGGVLHDVELGRQRRRGDSSHEKGSENDFLHGLLLGEYSDRGRSDRGIERPSGTPVPSRSPRFAVNPNKLCRVNHCAWLSCCTAERIAALPQQQTICRPEPKFRPRIIRRPMHTRGAIGKEGEPMTDLRATEIAIVADDEDGAGDSAVSWAAVAAGEGAGDAPLTL